MINVIVPTVRKESLEQFLKAWMPIFNKHDVYLYIVHDGEKPYVEYDGYLIGIGTRYLHKEEKKVQKVIYNKNDGVRNYGFWLADMMSPPVADVFFITLDDDTLPIGDPIQDHIDALNKKVPVSWINTAGDDYMRGFPYCVREEAEVVLSHGVWEGVKDWDAPTQLVNGNKDVTFFKGAIPKGVYYPMCGMNIAFKRKMLPYMYYAPMGYKVGMDRFADIWLGITSKRIIDEKGWAVVTGYAKVQHDRASNVWKNLQKEAKGLEANEGFWRGDLAGYEDYFKMYAEKRKLWEDLINGQV